MAFLIRHSVPPTRPRRPSSVLVGVVRRRPTSSSVIVQGPSLT